jgi:hypothetical protein
VFSVDQNDFTCIRRVCVPASQIGFLDIFVLPLVSAFVKVFPECQPLLDQVRGFLSKVTHTAAESESVTCLTTSS